MSKSNLQEAPVLKSKTASSSKSKISLLTFKEELFQDIEPKEALQVFDRMTYDLLGSDLCEETEYRNEILVLQKLFHKAMMGLKNNISPNDVHVLQISI